MASKLAQWWHKQQQLLQQKRRQQDRQFRPALEPLEDRLQPSSAYFAQTSYTVAAGTGASITLTLDTMPAGASLVSVSCTITDGTAKNSIDYSYSIPTAGFHAAGSQAFSIQTYTNSAYNPDRTVEVAIYSITVTGTGTVSIGSPSAAVLHITASAPATWAPTLPPVPNTGAGDALATGPINVSLLGGKTQDVVPLTDASASSCGCGSSQPVDGVSGPSFSKTVFYNSDTADARPILSTTWPSNAADGLPTSITVTLTWNGSAQSPVTFSTAGHSAGDNYLLAVQVSSAVTTSGYYPYTVQLQANYSGSPITRSLSGYAAVQANGSTYGTGWSLAGVDRLLSVAGGVLWLSGLGGARYFAAAGGGSGGSGQSYTSPIGELGSLVQNSNGTYTYTSLNKFLINFDANGYLTTKQDTHGLALTYSYDANHLLTQMTDAAGFVFTFGYTSGALATITYPGGATTLFAQDASHNLATLTNADATVRAFVYNSHHELTSDTAGPRQVTATYDSGNDTVTGVALGATGSWAITPQLTQGLNTAAQNATAAVAKVTDPYSKTVTYTLDNQGLPTKVQTPDGNNQQYTYNANEQPLTATDQNGHTTTMTYTASGDLATRTDAANNTYSYTYNSFNEVVTVQDPLGNTTTYGYDSGTGDLLTIKDALNNVTTQTWSNGELQTVVDANNHTTSYGYTVHRQLQTVTDALNNTSTYGYDAAGNLTTVTDPLLRVTTSAFDGMGRVTQVTDAAGGVATKLYDAAGNLTSQTDRSGLRTDYSYNSSGQEITQTVAAGTGLAQTSTNLYDTAGRLTGTLDPLSHLTQYVLDALGRVSVTIDALNNRATTYFDAASNVTGSSDSNGNLTQYLIDSLNRASVIINAAGGRATTLYDAAGNVTGSKDANGNLTQYLLDALNRASVVIDAAGNRATTLYDNVGNTTGSMDANGNLTQYVMDALNRASVTINAAGGHATTLYDAAGNVTGARDANNNLTQYLPDSLNRTTVTIDALSNRTTSLFDSHGNLTETLDQRNNATQYVYDSLNRASVTIDAQNNRLTNYYDGGSNITGTADANGHLTQFLFDVLNRATVTIDANSGRATSLFDAGGNVTGSQDPLGQLTQYLIDNLNRASVVIDPVGNRTTSLFDAAGNTTGVKDGRGHLTQYLFDNLNRASVTIDANGGRNTTLYDAASNVTSVTDANGHTSQYLIDSLNRASVTIDGDGNRTTILYDAQGNVTGSKDGSGNLTQYTIDALNRATVTTDATNHAVSTFYDASGNLTGVKDANAHLMQYLVDSLNRTTVTIDALNYRTSALFDAVGNQTSLKDAANNVSTVAFDALNRKTSQTDALGHTATFAYNADGLLTSQTDRLGRTDTYQYDADNRLTTAVWKDSGGSAVETMTYSYDENGNMLTAHNSNGTYTMTYDVLDRVTVAKDVWGNTLTMGYDSVGNRTSVTDSLGGTLTSAYDATNQLTNRYLSGTNITAIHLDLTYTAAGQIESERRYTGGSSPFTLVGTTTMTYDADLRVSNLKHVNGSGSNLANYTYTYDNANNVTAEQKNGTTVSYTYDATNQLQTDGTNNLTYDGTGNRTNGSNTTGTENQLTSDGTWNYTYDLEGNLTKKTKGLSAETWTYGYNNGNQMTQAKQWTKDPTNGGVLEMEADYKYDVFGNRIEQAVDPDGAGPLGFTIKRFALDGWGHGSGGFVGTENWDVWAILDGGNSNALVNRYLRGNALDQLFAREDATGLTAWYLTDRQGSTRDIMDNSALIWDTISYDGFGNVLTESNAGYGDRYKWTGREYDQETGLQYNRARYYDAKSGRWAGQDPLGFDAGDSNLYRYVSNAPTIAVDPAGLASYSWTVPSHGQIRFSNKIWNKAIAIFGIRTDVTVPGQFVQASIPVFQPPVNWPGWDARNGNALVPGIYLPNRYFWGADGHFDLDPFTPATIEGLAIFYGLTVTATFTRNPNSLIPNDDYYWVQEAHDSSNPKAGWFPDDGGGYWNKPNFPLAYPFQETGGDHLLEDHAGKFYPVPVFYRPGRPYFYFVPRELSLGNAYNFTRNRWIKSPVIATYSFKTYLVYKCAGDATQHKIGYIRWGYNLSLTGKSDRVTVDSRQIPTWVPLDYSPSKGNSP